MPVYEIEQYEVYSCKYRVSAENKAEAISKLLNGDGDMVDNSVEYIQGHDEMGMSVFQNRELAIELEKIGVPCDGEIIPSIREIEEVDA